MGRKRKSRGDQTMEEKSTQFSMRLAKHFTDRLDNAGEKLGLNRADLMRLIVAEKLPEYEERARQAADGRKDHR